jgi:hypothetical protein
VRFQVLTAVLLKIQVRVRKVTWERGSRRFEGPTAFGFNPEDNAITHRHGFTSRETLISD